MKFCITGTKKLKGICALQLYIFGVLTCHTSAYILHIITILNALSFTELRKLNDNQLLYYK